MRLPISLLLVTLTVCYYKADAVVCPELVKVATGILFYPEPLFQFQLSEFNAPPEAVEAKLEVKKCTDKMSVLNRILVEGALEQHD